VKEPPTEAALLFGVQGGFVRFQFIDQFLGPVDQGLI
jgi:hypothetical protein